MLGRAKELARRLTPAGAYDRLAAAWDRLRKLHPELARRRRAFERNNRDCGPGEMVLRPGLRLAVDPRSRGPFEHFCFRSLEMARELDAFLAAREGRGRLLDVGALHGLFALAFTAGRPEARALALDPSPPASEVLRANLRLNPGCEVEPLAVAAGAAVGELRMQLNWQHLEALPAGTAAAGAVTVPMVTLDQLAAERGFAPDLMKIDVEGYELAVLAGARRILTNDRPLLFLEVHPARLAALGSSAAAVGELLGEVGYRLELVEGGRSAAARLRRGGEVFRVIARPLPP